MTFRLPLGAALGALLISGLAMGAAMAAAKEPPACAAIAFRALPSGAGDGEQDAGLYKSRFGKIEVKATVKGGLAQNYYVTVNGQKPKPLPGALPASAAACAAEKKLSAPTKATEPCTGEKFTVLIDRSTKDRLVLLYSHAGRAATFCGAGVG